MKVLFIIPIYINKAGDLKNLQLTGGGFRYPYELAKNISDLKNVNVELMFFGSRDEEGKVDDMKVHIVKSKNFLVKYNGTTNPLPISLNFFNKIKQADVVHTFQMRTEASMIASIYCKFIGKPIFLTDTNFSGASLSRLINPEKFASGVLAISREDYDSWNAKNKKIIYGGVTLENFSYKGDKKKYVLYFGRITAHKGVDVLIEAMPKNYELIIAGSGLDVDYLKYLKRISKGKKIKFIINPTDKKATGLYQNASCFVLPATAKDYLGFSSKRPGLYALVIPEAMACGTPVIVSDVGALPDFIENNENGFVFHDRDTKELQAKILKITTNKKLAEKMGKKCRELAIKKYDWKVIAKNTAKIYSNYLYN